jgi:hypothetical protein
MARKANRKRSRQLPESPGWATGPGVRALGLALLALAGLGALGWGATLVHARAGEIMAREPVDVEIVWPRLPGQEGTWLGEGLRERIEAQVDASLAGRAIDARALAAVGETLAESGWFDGPPTVARTGDATLRISGRWREPACAVRADGRDYPIDWRGRPFPVDYPAGSSGLRVLVGVAAGPPIDGVGALRVLQPWPGEDVLAGLELLGPLLREPFAGQVAGVDVGDYFTRGRLAIVTDTDSRVIWGGRYGEFTPGEATTEQKISRLRAAASNPLYENRIDSGARRLDISGEHLILDRTGVP